MSIEQLQVDIEREEKEYADCEYKFSLLQDGWKARMKTQDEYMRLKAADIQLKKQMLKSLKFGGSND
ncbi:MAG: hypothetical protein DRH97_00375 [Chloroflexi bacterium]|nr:MAG: hypothetical protein DRH97_00375 [Chloroflexota bacterium]